MREIDSTCRQDLFVKNKLCSSTQMFIKFKLLSGKRVYVFANLFVWASSGGKFAKCDGIWIFGNGFFDKPKSISIGSGYQFWQSQFSNMHSEWSFSFDGTPYHEDRSSQKRKKILVALWVGLSAAVYLNKKTYWK